MLWFKKKKNEDVQPDSIAKQIGLIADTAGFERLQEKVNKYYDIIFKKIDELASDGLYQYNSRHHKEFTELCFIRETNANSVLLEMVAEKFSKNGFSVVLTVYAVDYLDLTIMWPRRRL